MKKIELRQPGIAEIPMLNAVPVRIQRSRQHKQVSPNGLPIVYVGRPSKWGNPFMIEKERELWIVFTYENERLDIIASFLTKQDAHNYSVTQFEQYISWLEPSKYGLNEDEYKNEMEAWNDFVGEIKGKNLSCWCPLDCKCHADILLEIANW